MEELTGLLTWSKTNQMTFNGRVKNSHDATAFVVDVSWVLGQYLNSCVVVSTAAGLSALGYLTPVSLALLLQEISWGPYHEVDQLTPSLRTILHQQDALRQYSGIATTGNHDARLRHEEAIQAAARAVGGGFGGSGGGDGRCGGEGGGGGGRGGSRGGGGRGGRDLPSAKGAVHINPHHRPNRDLIPGENTRDVLRTFALPTLGGSTWCKRWHHGGC